MINDHFLEIMALDWMIDKPLTPDKEKSNKPIEDKHLTTWCSWRQIRTQLKKFSLCCQTGIRAWKQRHVLTKRGKKHNYSLLLRHLSKGNRVESVSRLLKQITYMREKEKEVSDLPLNVHKKLRLKEVEWPKIYYFLTQGKLFLHYYLLAKDNKC